MYFPESGRRKPSCHQSDQQLEREVQIAAGQVWVEMHVTDWAVAQKEEPELDAVLWCWDLGRKLI